jgi:hypothetical protein
MARNACDTIISKISDHPIRRECLRLKIVRLQHELAGKDPSPIEKVLAERVAVCYLDVYFSDQLAYGKAVRLSHAEFFERCRDRAHRRYLHAVKTLAECRKLAAQTIQQTVESFRLVG